MEEKMIGLAVGKPGLYLCQSCQRLFTHGGLCPECATRSNYSILIRYVPRTVLLADVPTTDVRRCTTGMVGLDRVLGGGLVSGSLVVLGGAPGIGKSTLLLTAGADLAVSHPPVLYVTAEESVQAVKLRADRVLIPPPGYYALAERDLDAIQNQIGAAETLLLDSIQAVSLPALDAPPGSVTQVRAACFRLLAWARAGLTVVFTCHVTKDGTLAGPSSLAHLVDVELCLEEAPDGHVLLSARKNRFGPTTERATFRMTERGLVEEGKTG